ncbi:adenylate/guanylate cyclase domain-containing protein [Streptomyces sp. NPDC013157]|uniref:adenylate/guanylate cyclase domain-containing protein n=1 Tax=Streptomyces sp. NPDC013157 TaxID=3364861 RepID=UPI00369C21CA
MNGDTGTHCAGCRTRLSAGARFCSGCGLPCAQDAGPGGQPVEERRVVSVVFCDLVGSTALSGRLDPETLRSVTLRYFDLMRHQIEAHGGTVEKFIGDAVMAVFGVPVMHEDDARRAAAAALDMVDALEELNADLTRAPGVRLDVRIGVNTGEAVASSDASARQALVSGEVVNVAARLEQNAAAGEILIGPLTLRAIGPAAVVEEAGPLLLKGKTDPVTAHRLLAVVDHDPEHLRRFDIPFVGREPELAELRLVLDKTNDGRGCHLVTVYGEAGIGKTRLIREWLHREHADGTGGPGADRLAFVGADPAAFVAAGTGRPGMARPRPVYGAGRCRPYGDAGSLAPLAEALRSLLDRAGGVTGPGGLDGFGEDERAEAAEALASLEAGVLRDGTPSPSFDETCAALAGLLGALASRLPLVLVLDDCHWADALLLEALDRLVEDLDHAAVMVVCVARPELLDVRPDWGSGRLKSVSLMLSGFSARESATFAAGLAEVGAHAADTLPAHVMERAEGNPFHLEQLLALRAEGGAADELPPTVQALLGARIDALEQTERGTLDLASVVGREFRTDQVADLAAAGEDGTGPETVRSAVRGLTRRRLVTPAPRRPGAGALVRFSSGLVQEVVYQAMAKRVRADRHEHAADLPATRQAGDAAVGFHLERAHRYRGDLGLFDEHTERLRHRAAQSLAAAGAGALARADLSRAEDLLTRATALARPGESTWPDAARRLAEARLALGRPAEARVLLLRVLTAATASGDRLARAHACLTLATVDPTAGPAHLRTAETVETADPGLLDTALHPAPAVSPAAPADSAAPAAAGPAVSPADVAAAVLPVFEAADDALGLARAQLRLAQGEQARGRHAAAEQLLSRALADAVRADAEPERAAALGALGVSLWLGPETVPSAVERCRTLLAEHAGERRTVRVTLNCPLAVLLALRQRFAEARECLAVAERFARDLGFAEAAVFLPFFSAAVETLAGQPDRAEASLREAERSCRAAGEDGLPAPMARELARLLVARGARREALGRIEPADADLPSSEAADRDGLLAVIAALDGEFTEAERLADRATAHATRTDSPIVRAVALTDRARTQLLLGRPDPAAAAAREAGHLFAAKGHLPGVAQAAELTRRAARAEPTDTRPAPSPSSGTREPGPWSPAPRPSDVRSPDTGRPTSEEDLEE